MSISSVLVLGGGIFGTMAAIELRQRGHQVRLLDPGPLPNPLAASTDISKVVRMDYGTDEDYTAMAEEAIRRWRGWNESFGLSLYRETGILVLRQQPLAPGEFALESYQRALERGHEPVRLNSDDVRRQFPAINADRYVDGYLNPVGGYVVATTVLATLVQHAQALGVEYALGEAFDRFIYNGSAVTGVVTRAGSRYEADVVVAAVGSWTPHIIPGLRDIFRSTAMPVFHLTPPTPSLYEPPRFIVFLADEPVTGYYGLPYHPEAKVVKFAFHGPGRELVPESPERVVSPAQIEHLRRFLRTTCPDLAEAPLANARVCLYSDTRDGHFWIARDPEHPGLVVATGDSGHAFKFTPVLGEYIADTVEAKPFAYADKFRWRPEVQDTPQEEQLRAKEA